MITIEKSRLLDESPSKTHKSGHRRIEKVYFSKKRDQIVAVIDSGNGSQKIVEMSELQKEPASVFVAFMTRLIMEDVG